MKSIKGKGLWRKVLVVTLSFTVALSMMNFSVFAEQGNYASASNETKAGENIDWTDWTDTSSLPISAGNYRLKVDVNLSNTWAVPKDKTTNLDLNGHIVQPKPSIAKTSRFTVISINSSSASTRTTFGLYDTSSGETGKITGGYGNTSVTAEEQSTFCAGGVAVGTSNGTGNATFNFYSGNISGNSSPADSGRAGGVMVFRDGTNNTFNMYGGTISDNTAFQSGGVQVEGNFNMYSGKIINNTASRVGGISVWDHSNSCNIGYDSTKVESGEKPLIAGNKSTNYYGAGGIRNVGTLNIGEAEISGNEAYGSGDQAGNGAGINNLSGGTCTLTQGAVITGNKSYPTNPGSSTIGAAAICNTGKLVLKGGAESGAGIQITNNTSTSTIVGGLYNEGTLEMQGKIVIDGNKGKAGALTDNSNLTLNTNKSKVNVTGDLSGSKIGFVLTKSTPAKGALTESTGRLTANYISKNVGATLDEYFQLETNVSTYEQVWGGTSTTPGTSQTEVWVWEHSHNWIYKSGTGSNLNRAYVYCNTTTTKCEHYGEDHSEYLQISTPDKTYDGNPYDGFTMDVNNITPLTGAEPSSPRYSGINGTVYPESTTPPTLPGEYQAKVTIGGANAISTFEIIPGTPTYTPPEGVSVVYDKDSHEMATPGEATNGVMMYHVQGSSDEWTSTVPERTEPGEYIVEYYIKGNTGYSDIGSETSPKGTITSDIHKNAIQAEVIDYSNVYDAQFHGIIVNVLSPGEEGRYTVYYSNDQEDWDTDLHNQFVNAGESQIVYYKVVDNEGILTDATGHGYVTITPKQVVITPDPNQSKIYLEDEPELTYKANGLIGGATLEGDLGRKYQHEDDPTLDDAGLYDFTLGTLDAGTNYTLKLDEDSPQFEIKKATMNITSSGYEDEYDGEAHGITVSGYPEGATVWYSETEEPISSYNNQPIKYTNVTDGEKTVYYYVTCDNYETVHGSETVNITPATMDVDSTGFKLQYDGEEHSIQVDVNEPEVGYKTEYSTDNGATWSETNPKFTNVTDNNNKVLYRVTCANYTTVEDSVEAVIMPAPMNPIAADISVRYDGQPHQIAVSSYPEGSTVTYSLSEEGPYTVDNPSFTNVTDETTVYYKVDCPNYVEYKGSATVEITPLEMTVSGEDVSVVYDGENHHINFICDQPGAKLQYSLSAEGPFTDDIINQKNVTESPITVYCQATLANYATVKTSATIEITPADMPHTASGFNLPYDKTGHQIVVSGYPEGAKVTYSTDGITYREANPTFTNVTEPGTKVYYKITCENYEDASGSVDVSINPIDPTYTAPVGKSLTHQQGTEQELITLGSVTEGEGTMHYRLGESGSWIEGSPKAEAAGEYKIYYYVEGADPNYNDVGSEDNPISFVTSTIGQGTISYSTSPVTHEYDGNEYSISVNVTEPTNYKIQYSTDGVTFTDNNPKFSQVSDNGQPYTVYFQITAEDYGTVTSSTTVTITPKPAKVIPTGETKVYGENDPETYAYTCPDLISGDSLEGSLSRAAGENVGSYDYNLNDLHNKNYSLTLDETNKFKITPKLLTPDMVTLNPVTTPYTGHEQTVNFTVYDKDLEKEITNVDYVIDPSSKLAGTDAGEYKAIFTGQHNYYTEEGKPVEKVWNITKVTPTYTVPIEATYTYDGEAKPLIAGGGQVTGGTMMYSADGGETWGSEVPQGTNAKQYPIQYYVKGDKNHEDIGSATEPIGTITSEILKADMEWTSSGVVTTYDKNSHSITVTPTTPGDATVKYRLKGETEYITTNPSFTDANEDGYVVEYEITADNYNTAYGEEKVIINPATVEIIPKALSKVYGKNDPEELSSSYDVKCAVEGYKFINDDLTREEGEDVVDGGYQYSIENMSLEGNNFVLKMTENPEVFTITPKKLTSDMITIIDQKGKEKSSFEYVGSPIRVSYKLYDTELKKEIGWDDYMQVIDKCTLEATNVGEYEINIKGLRNYEDVGTQKWVITKAYPTLVDPQPKELEYTATEQELVVPGTSEGGTVMYKVEGEEEWTSTPPMKVEPGDYTVEYYVKGDSNHYDLGSEAEPYGTVDSTIQKAKINASAKDVKVTYDKNDYSINVNVPTLINEHTITYSIDGKEYANEKPSFTEVGTHNVYYKITANGYEDYNGSASVVILPKLVTVLPDYGQKKVYGENNPKVYTYTTEGLFEGDSITGKLAREKGENVGEYEYNLGTLAVGNNYTLQMAVNPPTFEITPKELTKEMVSINPSETEYTGKTITPKVAVKDGDKILKEDVDYQIEKTSATEAKDPGTYKITVKGIGNYKGKVLDTWKITGQKPVPPKPDPDPDPKKPDPKPTPNPPINHPKTRKVIHKNVRGIGTGDENEIALMAGLITVGGLGALGIKRKTKKSKEIDN